MANETIKALLMLAMFGALEAALHLPGKLKPLRVARTVWSRHDQR